MRSTQIRSLFFDFFGARGHHRVPSSPLVPDDPTLLLANAGMNQFAPYFLGAAAPPWPRAMSVQKCVRTVDIDNVGRTTRHATFFEMLGNFSFGDYFKAEAIAYAWELFTEGYGLDPGRLWVTVYEHDDDAYRLWRRAGVPADRIQRLGAPDNYWDMGVPGPCGPSSELHYDRGPGFGREGGPAVDGERYQELWNLVFMQSLRGAGEGLDYPVVGGLPRPSIDTGLGLDRLAAILQGVDTVCETDLLRPVLTRLEELARRRYPGREGGEVSTAFRAATEHARAVAFLVADGVVPGSTGRGYVLRRLLRRAVHRARFLGVTGPVVPELTAEVVAVLGADWPELERRRDTIAEVAHREEEAFDRTLRQGTRILDSAIGRAVAGGRTRLPGETAFELHDTYGFPVELTAEAARAAGLEVDRDRFAELLEEQRRRAHADSAAARSAAGRRTETFRRLLGEHGPTRFTGYGSTLGSARVLALLVEGAPARAAREGCRVEVLLDASPFYARSGGQVGDTGALRTGEGAEIAVEDTAPGVPGLHVHTGRVVRGEVRVGQEVAAEVDAGRRAAAERSHSATHVLHAMLRRTLGEHAAQRGSLVAPGRLRFDFAHSRPLGEDGLRLVERRVNAYLGDDPEVRVWHGGYAEARAAGAVALFGERYGDRVRVVDIGDESRELCGGTHVGHGTQAGPVRLLGESSVGSGLRRVEALTGPDALAHYDRERALLAGMGQALGAPPEEAPARLRTVLDSLARAQAELARLRRERADERAARLAEGAEPVPGGWLVVAEVGEDESDLRALAEAVHARRGGTGVVVVGARPGGAARLTAVLSPDLAARGALGRAVLTEAA
ncbi:alanine--tRNA ligase, partial [Streptomonospora nanhaiensis]